MPKHGNKLQDLYPEVAKEWNHEKNTLKLSDITFGSGRKVWWKGACGHEWQAKVANRTTLKNGCYYCKSTSVVRDENRLSLRFPIIAAELHPSENGNIKASEIAFGSTKQLWWLGNCGHEFFTSPNRRTSNDIGCIICNGTINDGNRLSSNASHLIKDWCTDKNGNLKPENISINSSKCVWWYDSKCGHSWKDFISARVKGAKCRKCFPKFVNDENRLSLVNPEL
jgi:hypothetical protein